MSEVFRYGEDVSHDVFKNLTDFERKGTVVQFNDARQLLAVDVSENLGPRKDTYISYRQSAAISKGTKAPY